jgi:hypothetical protein
VVLTDCFHIRWHKAVGDETGRQRGRLAACGVDRPACRPPAANKNDRRLKVDRPAASKETKRFCPECAIVAYVWSDWVRSDCRIRIKAPCKRGAIVPARRRADRLAPAGERATPLTALL